jgi:hypothetical protein
MYFVSPWKAKLWILKVQVSNAWDRKRGRQQQAQGPSPQGARMLRKGQGGKFLGAATPVWNKYGEEPCSFPKGVKTPEMA